MHHLRYNIEDNLSQMSTFTGVRIDLFCRCIYYSRDLHLKVSHRTNKRSRSPFLMPSRVDEIGWLACHFATSVYKGQANCEKIGFSTEVFINTSTLQHRLMTSRTHVEDHMCLLTNYCSIQGTPTPPYSTRKQGL